MSQSNKSGRLIAIIIMMALFAMIAFVTNLCTPMATIIKNQLAVSNVLAQVGNYANFIAYLVMGIPAGLLIKKVGYKNTALIALATGAVGVLIQWFSGSLDSSNPGLVFTVYIIGAFIAGLCMCMLNTVVNPMLNLLGGGGNKGNQLILIGGVFNSAAAVAIYILMGALIGEVTKAKIADATPALLIALAIFVVGFIVIALTKIQEPQQVSPEKKKQEKVQEATGKQYSAFSFRHFKLGIAAIFLYMGIEVGVPNFMQQYLANPVTDATPGLGMDAGIVGCIVAVYWFLMLVGRFIGGAIGAKVSSRAMLSFTAALAFLLVLVGMLLPATITTTVPGVDWTNLKMIYAEIPVGMLLFLLVGLCTSVMWGGIFNLATEGLGKYTAIASGAFMMMVFGCAVMSFIQASVADFTHDYMISYIVVLVCALYLLYYAIFGSKNVNKNIPVD